MKQSKLIKIKIYIVTYNNNPILNDWALKTLFNSNCMISNNKKEVNKEEVNKEEVNKEEVNKEENKKFDECLFKYDIQVNVINNHSNIRINEEYKNKINLMNNECRPDFSTGHLSRNWNQALIHGFKCLKNPDTDYVICCQNDVKFTKNWLELLMQMHEKYTFIQYGQGDSFHSYKPDAVKQIGLWDERFCNIGYQEHDYFLRALIYNFDKSSINSTNSRQFHNEMDLQILEKTKCGSKRGEKSHNESRQYHKVSRVVFRHKWGNVQPARWKKNFKWIPKKAKSPSYVYYPYFEKHIHDLKGKGYIFR